MPSFVQPWILLGLGLLPLLWWLLRQLPPPPRRQVFPSLRLLGPPEAAEERAGRVPPWLLVLRLSLAASLILGLAQPLLRPAEPMAGDGPLLLVVDDGWAAAPDWDRRLDLMDNLLAEAERHDWTAAMVSTAKRGQPRPRVNFSRAADLRAELRGMTPRPWGTDRAAVAASLPEKAGRVVWISDGLSDGSRDFPELLAGIGPTAIAGGYGEGPLVLRPPVFDASGGLRLTLERGRPGGPRRVHVRAFDGEDRLLARQEVDFADGVGRVESFLPLAAELAARLGRLDVEEGGSAAAAVLIDESSLRRPVGILSSPADVAAGPLHPSHFPARALETAAEVRRGRLEDLLARPLSLLIIAAPEPMTGEQKQMLAQWTAQGGLLLHFAGPRLAESGGADLDLPVSLRHGERSLGGIMSWREAAEISPFPTDSPFAGLEIPADIKITRQVLAEPTVDPGVRVWARLTDGTPLVSAAKREQGWSVLFHVAADPSWSDLLLSGLFVHMLERLVETAHGVDKESKSAPLPPLLALDAFGRAGKPPQDTLALAPEVSAPGPGHPPGIYGDMGRRRAFNLSPSIEHMRPLGPSVADLTRINLEGVGAEVDLRPAFLALALTLLLADMAAGLFLTGNRRWAALALLLCLSFPAAADVGLTRDTRLAYLVTGNARLDGVSRAGLEGLGVMLERRTAVEMGPPAAFDPERDDPSFFPLVYWPLTPMAPDLSPAALSRLRRFLENGGTILFDAQGDGGEHLTRLAENLGIPPLARMNPDHVLARSYYLLTSFPGRRDQGAPWVEALPRAGGDGVPSVVAGSNDWAGAWAVDDGLRPLFPLAPGGEAQRELAFRFGINLVMMVLSGNYKTDQVHLPAILERLGR